MSPRRLAAGFIQGVVFEGKPLLVPDTAVRGYMVSVYRHESFGTLKVLLIR